MDWTTYVQDVRLVEGVRETGEVPATIPDHMTLDGFAVEIERGTWGITCTGNGVATVTVSVRAGNVHVARDDLSRQPRVYIGGQRVMVPPSGIPDVPTDAQQWLRLRIYALHIRVVPHASW